MLEDTLDLLGLKHLAVYTIFRMSIRILGYPRILNDTMELGLGYPAVYMYTTYMSLRILADTPDWDFDTWLCSLYLGCPKVS